MFKLEATKTTCPSWLVHQMSEGEQHDGGDGDDVSHNRMYYFAIPPKVFLDSAAAIKATGVSETGWTRLIAEKPFGRDLKSAQELTESLKQHFTEDYIYRIDHYLGQEMVQNMLITRFGNVLFENIWNRNLLKVCPSTLRKTLEQKVVADILMIMDSFVMLYRTICYKSFPIWQWNHP